MNSSVFEMAIHDLPKYVVFSVQIAAATKLGEGVRSEEIIVGSLNDSLLRSIDFAITFAVLLPFLDLH